MDIYSNSINLTMNKKISDALTHSYTYCAELVKESKSNFYSGMFLMPSPKREAVYSIYCWMREIDDIADQPLPKRKKLSQLLAYYRLTQKILKNEISDYDLLILGKHWLAFRDTIIQYQIPIQYLKDMLLGQIHVVQRKTIKTLQELYLYCYRVASVVGLILLKIWGYSGGEETEKLAEFRGVAFQLTNILRDFTHDLNEGYHYIPLELIEINKENVAFKKEELLQAFNHLINQTEDYYKKSSALEQFVHEDGYVCLRVMSEFYYAIFRKIKESPPKILEYRKIKISIFNKIYLILKTLFISKFLKH